MKIDQLGKRQITGRSPFNTSAGQFQNKHRISSFRLFIGSSCKGNQGTLSIERDKVMSLLSDSSIALQATTIPGQHSQTRTGKDRGIGANGSVQ